MKTNHLNRRGVTAVEFAVVAPIIFATIFALIEFSMVYKVQGALTTAVLMGGRTASIETSDAGMVDQEIRDNLQTFGVPNPTISISPSVLDPSVREVQISVVIDSTKENGFIFRRFFAGPLQKTATFTRF